MGPGAGWSVGGLEHLSHSHGVAILSCSDLKRLLWTSPFSNETATDRDALLQFKASLSQQSPALVSWNTTSDFCHWTGVTCSLRHKGRVSALNLSSAGLVGTISPAIGNLTFLKILDLSSNKLQGEIPSTIGRLWQLQYLIFTGNSLHGGITDGLSNCTGLVNIILDKNHLTGEIPSWLGGFPKLVALILSKNNLTGSIPPSLGNLTYLQALYLQYNQLEGSIPKELGRLKNLQWFALFANHLSGEVPEAVFNLSSVIGFGVDQNDLHGTLPSNWGNNQPNLEFIYLAVNHFTGNVPASLANATMIDTIDLGLNNFTGRMPPEIGTLCPSIFSFDSNQIEASTMEGWEFVTLLTNCTWLRVLSFRNNMLAGQLPASVGNLSSTHLQVLYTGFNEIYGNIPPGIGNLVNLQKLFLSHNHFSGVLPSTIYRLKMMRALGIDGNMLSGTIPPSIGNLTLLQIITMDNNNLEGSLPSSISNLQMLSVATLSRNAFAGPIPKEIFNLSSLSYILDLSDNHFNGPLPPEVGSLTKLVYLNISRNNLSGSLPDTLSNCQSLLELHLDDNSFSGSLPTSISEMYGLVVLNLTENFLSGAIPQEFGRLKGLEELYLAHNNLSGQIPMTLQNMTSLSQLDISFNHLSGLVPMQGVFAKSTGFLFVGNNELCGGLQELHLPACPVHSRKHRDMKRHVVLIIIISTGSLFCVILVLLSFYWRRKKGPHATTMAGAAISFLDDKYPKVSYAELFQGTNGFSGSNLIGRGRYGSVYKGTLSLKNVETEVAVKVFDLQQSGSSKSFVVECGALSKIRHRNLISVITCCSSSDSKQNNFKAIVFELMPNQSLDKWLHYLNPDSDVSRPIPGLTLLQRLNIAVNVADAMDYLHNNCEPPIVHCDLKPSNILLNVDFVACVGDFGIAKILSDSEGDPVINSNTFTGIRGTVGYVAPEYGEGGQVSLCGDVFSFGVLLLEMFTGKAPTDAMFVDGLTLQGFVEIAFPEKLMDIIDPVLLSTDETYARNGGEEIENAITSVSKLALSCTKLTPSERKPMSDAAAEMRKIRSCYLANLPRANN
ncbi:probable LRR receptor-like serine/threonine-protein kinase At3g47570 isoform X2 [Miscanthus floridulus]|uniref:probable LRR receptor-like serine/threonine-protein kinase At3g47570 isoform X2 n=1 Tax=Miscanthus floridulus TaxID=154761 RepID=UPI0034577E0C